MRFIYYINNSFFTLTLLGYMTIIWGMFMQIFLGGIQVLLFIILLFNLDKFSKNIKQHLSIYGVFSGVYLLWFFTVGLTQDSIWSLVLLPMSLGSYFTFIVYQLNKQIS